jgi:uncharacterized protein
MILSFSFTNYRSVKNKVTLSMLPVKAFKELPDNWFKTEAGINVLRMAVIFGANASGKSNILRALNEFRKYIVNSTDLKVNQPITLFDPFLLDESTKQAPSVFYIQFFSEDFIRHEYSIEIISDKVLKEELIYYPKGQKVNIFKRQDGNPIIFGSVLKGEKKSIEARLLPNQLFLSKGANENIEILKGIYQYFMDKIVEQLNFRNLYTESVVSNLIATFLKEKTADFILRISKIIYALDTGISSFEIRKGEGLNLLHGFPDEVAQIINPNVFKDFENELGYEILTYHKVFDPNGNEIKRIPFNIERESSGTRSLFLMAVFLIDAIDSGKVLYIDEFEQNLHPLLVRSLLTMFNNPAINKGNAQLIFTTHDISLLTNELFRRDQIWFTEKNERGITELFSMADIDGVRNNIPFDKWYLSGRFGATPVINETQAYYGDVQKSR